MPTESRWIMTNSAPVMDRQAVYEDYERTRQAFHRLLRTATESDLRRPSRGTRWTNGQLLWHMLFGYLIVRVLLVVTRLFARLPRGMSQGFARLLNAATGPFDTVNYAGPVGAVKVCGPHRMEAAFDRITASLRRRLEAETDVGLTRGMHYPVRWDPFFTDCMTRADLYRYPIRHFDFHHRQLTLDEDGGG